MRKNHTKLVELTWQLNRKGNWFRLTEGKTLFTKPIAQTFIDGDEYVWTHKEIMELIKAYHTADIESIKMINSGQAGDITKAEMPFLEKIKEFIIKLEKEVN